MVNGELAPACVSLSPRCDVSLDGGGGPTTTATTTPPADDDRAGNMVQSNKLTTRAQLGWAS